MQPEARVDGASVGRKTQLESHGVAFAADKARMGVRQFTHDNNWRCNRTIGQVNFVTRKLLCEVQWLPPANIDGHGFRELAQIGSVEIRAIRV
jgi:hypothetical protein